jgi:tetratricopeptide (TPR) repeat protein
VLARERMGRWFTIGACVLLIGLLASLHVYRPVVASIAYRKALIARDHADWKTAMDQYLICLQNDPYFVEAWYRLAFLCAQFPGTDEQAIEYYLQVIDLAPNYGDVNTNLATLYLRRDRKKDALPYIQRAAELNPYNLALRTTLAHLYLDLGLTRELKNETMEILRLDRTNAWAQEIWETRFRQEKPDTTNAPPRVRKIPATRPVPYRPR